jgi:hypothetical protein
MQLNEINPSSPRHDPRGRAPEAESAPATETRALVVLGSTNNGPELQAVYRYAPFVAHLIAIKDQHPQTRERRRAEPNEAVAAYRATARILS